MEPVEIVDTNLSHAVVVTSDGYVIDATPWNNVLQNGVIYSRLEDHPIHSVIKASMEEDRRAGREFFARNTMVSYPYAVSESRHGDLRTSELPVALKPLGGNRFLHSSIGVGFQRQEAVQFRQ